MRRHALIITFAIVAIAAPIFSQSFDVASINRNTTADPRLRQLGIQPGGRLVATNTQVRLLIQTAYQLPGYRVLGGPDWIDSDGYDIEAKAGSEVAATPQQMRIMQQSLLAGDKSWGAYSPLLGQEGWPRRQKR